MPVECREIFRQRNEENSVKQSFHCKIWKNKTVIRRVVWLDRNISATSVTLAIRVPVRLPANLYLSSGVISKCWTPPGRPANKHIGADTKQISQSISTFLLKNRTNICLSSRLCWSFLVSFYGLVSCSYTHVIIDEPICAKIISKSNTEKPAFKKCSLPSRG